MNGKMRQLTDAEISRFASRKGVRKNAVENFLGSMGISSCIAAYGNMNMDARMYRWNYATQKAIHDGITKACSSRKRRRR